MATPHGVALTMSSVVDSRMRREDRGHSIAAPYSLPMCSCLPFYGFKTTFKRYVS
ncbi:hypothetical protein M404DRAFT_1001533, partial [Pisolithus tinctorius Marx 270]